MPKEDLPKFENVFCCGWPKVLFVTPKPVVEVLVAPNNGLFAVNKEFEVGAAAGCELRPKPVVCPNVPNPVVGCAGFPNIPVKIEW